MRRILISVVLLSPLLCTADPLLTITCEPVKGVDQAYGPTLADRWKSAGKPLPPPHLSNPRQFELPDYHSTYIVDSNRKKLTRIQVPSEATEKTLKETGVTSTPARDVPIIVYLPDVIRAAESMSFETTVYSFYPKLGMMFEMATSYDPGGPAASQIIFFAKCEYAWSGRP
jgi:hypothetical protein